VSIPISSLEEGIRLVKAGQAGEAIYHLRMAIVEEPGNPIAHEYLGAAFAYEHDRDSAILELQEAVRLNPENAAFRYNLGQGYEVIGDLKSACMEYATALSINPDYRLARSAHYALDRSTYTQS
jgi:Flp pilus assembly protein TadD